MDADPFYRAFVAEVTVSESGQMTWYPQLGHTVIAFGTAHQAEQKMASLRAFCQQVLPRIGWAHYQRITLQYNGQLIAERNP
ncbi:MAG: hypothetical protein DDT34_02516 [Firmicutes bacterium]|nr:hypothetical protein [Bacillota bacterium]